MPCDTWLLNVFKTSVCHMDCMCVLTVNILGVSASWSISHETLQDPCLFLFCVLHNAHTHIYTHAHTHTRIHILRAEIWGWNRCVSNIFWRYTLDFRRNDIRHHALVCPSSLRIFVCTYLCVLTRRNKNRERDRGKDTDRDRERASANMCMRGWKMDEWIARCIHKRLKDRRVIQSTSV